MIAVRDRRDAWVGPSPDLNIDYQRALVGRAKATASTRAKWRSSPSACCRVLENHLTPPTLSERRFINNLRDQLPSSVRPFGCRYFLAGLPPGFSAKLTFLSASWSIGCGHDSTTQRRLYRLCSNYAGWGADSSPNQRQFREMTSNVFSVLPAGLVRRGRSKGVRSQTLYPAVPQVLVWQEDLLKNYSGSCYLLRTVFRRCSQQRRPRACFLAPPPVRLSTYHAADSTEIQPFGPFHKPSAPSLLRIHARRKSFPAQSNSYKAIRRTCLYFEWVTAGTPGAYTRPDEVARNGAFQG